MVEVLTRTPHAPIAQQRKNEWLNRRNRRRRELNSRQVGCYRFSAAAPSDHAGAMCLFIAQRQDAAWSEGMINPDAHAGVADIKDAGCKRKGIPLVGRRKGKACNRLVDRLSLMLSDIAADPLDKIIGVF